MRKVGVLGCERCRGVLGLWGYFRMMKVGGSWIVGVLQDDEGGGFLDSGGT